MSFLPYKKLTKYISLSLLIAVVAAFAAFKVLFSPPRLKKVFTEFASEALNRPVSIEAAELIPGKLILKDINVGFREEEKKLTDKENYVKCRKAEVGFKILPLFSRKFVFTDIAFSSPEINVIKKPTVNPGRIFKGLLLGTKLGQDINFEGRKFRIKDGSVIFSGSEQSNIKVSDIEIEVRGSSIGEPVSVSLEFKSPQIGLDSFILGAAVDISENAGIINNLRIAGYDSIFTLKGTVENILNIPKADLNYKLEKVAEKMFDGKVKFFQQPEVKGKIESDLMKPIITLRADLTNAEINLDEFNKAAGEEFKVQGGITLSSKGAVINWYVLQLANQSVSGTGNIGKLKEVDINLISEELDLAKLSRNFKFIRKYVAAGLMNIRGNVESNGKPLQFSGNVKINNFKVKNFPGLINLYRKIARSKKQVVDLGEFSVNLFVNKKELQINQMNASGGDVTGRGRGYISKNGEIDFVLYPQILGRELNYRIYGSTDNIQLDLK